MACEAVGGDLLDLLARLAVVGGLVQEHQRQVLDDDQVLAQAVVQFGGDAFALRLLRIDQLAREGLLRGLRALQLRDAVSDRRARRPRRRRARPASETTTCGKTAAARRRADSVPSVFQTPSLLAAITLKVYSPGGRCE